MGCDLLLLLLDFSYHTAKTKEHRRTLRWKVFFGIGACMSIAMGGVCVALYASLFRRNPDNVSQSLLTAGYAPVAFLFKLATKLCVTKSGNKDFSSPAGCAMGMIAGAQNVIIAVGISDVSTLLLLLTIDFLEGLYLYSETLTVVLCDSRHAATYYQNTCAVSGAIIYDMVRGASIEDESKKNQESGITPKNMEKLKSLKAVAAGLKDKLHSARVCKEAEEMAEDLVWACSPSATRARSDSKHFTDRRHSKATNLRMQMIASLSAHERGSYELIELFQRSLHITLVEAGTGVVSLILFFWPTNIRPYFRHMRGAPQVIQNTTDCLMATATGSDTLGRRSSVGTVVGGASVSLRISQEQNESQYLQGMTFLFILVACQLASFGMFCYGFQRAANISLWRVGVFITGRHKRHYICSGLMAILWTFALDLDHYGCDPLFQFEWLSANATNATSTV